MVKEAKKKHRRDEKEAEYGDLAMEFSMSESESEEYDDSMDEDEYEPISYNKYIRYSVKPLTSTIKPKTGNKDLTWIPDHPHVGPGNPIYPWAKTEIDDIAREHDIAYGIANTPWDVYEADKKFLDKMSKVEPKTANEWWAQKIGQLGINIKYGFERKFGIAYPTFTEKQVAEFSKNPRFKALQNEWKQNTNYAVAGSFIGGSLLALGASKINWRNMFKRVQNTKLGRWVMDKIKGKNLLDPFQRSVGHVEKTASDYMLNKKLMFDDRHQDK